MKILSKEFGNWSAICDHLLHSNFLSSVENVSLLAHENKKYLLEIKERLLIMRHKPSIIGRDIPETLGLVKHSCYYFSTYWI